MTTQVRLSILAEQTRQRAEMARASADIDPAAAIRTLADTVANLQVRAADFGAPLRRVSTP